jgi:hypothetical protein
MKAELKQQRERFYKLLSNDEEIIALGKEIIANEIEGDNVANYNLIKFTLGQYGVEASMYDPSTIDSPRPQMYYDILKTNAIVRCIDYINHGAIRV